VPVDRGRDTTAEQRLTNCFLSKMSGRYEIVDEDHVGGREGVASEWKTIRAVFHNFAFLPSKRGVHTESKVLKCHGLEWQIELYPGGHPNSSEDDVFVLIYLSCQSCTDTNKIKANFRTRIPSAGKAKEGGFDIYSTNDIPSESLDWGMGDLVKREDVLDISKNYLVDGNLTVEVDIQVMLDKPLAWTPTNTVCSDMLAFFDAADADSTDISFEICSEEENALLYAHGPILAARCPSLASLAEECGPDASIPIVDVQADVFRMILCYVYGGKVPAKDIIKEQAKDIIRAADKYGCTGLKLAAEAEMAAAGITSENAAELILFADATNCAMLKEVAMEFFAENAQAVMASKGFNQVAESPAIMREMMAIGFGGRKKRPASSNADSERDYKRMRVSTLRQKLDDRSLDVDGSREMLVSRLEIADAEARAQAEALARAQAAENEDNDE